MMVRRKFSMEVLERRQLFAAVSQNFTNPLDVDDSGLVTAADALAVINALNWNDFKSGYVDESATQYLDVNGSGNVTAVDALMVINALNRHSMPLNVVVSIDPDQDRNGNGVVLESDVRLRGQTSVDSKVSVLVDALDKDLQPIVGRQRSVETVADPHGEFSVEHELFFGLNQLTVTVTDPLGRQAVVKHEIVYGDVVADWNAALLNVVRDWKGTSDDPYQGRIVTEPPPLMARNAAMIHLAIFDAINAVQSQYGSYVDNDFGAGDASAEAAAASAAYEVAISIYPESREREVWSATLAESLQSLADGPGKTAGIDLGQRVAAAVLQSRSGDGSDAVVDYVYDTSPGRWSRTSPDFLPPLLPQWRQVRPLAVDDITVYRADAPPELTSEEYAEAVDEVMRLGGKDSSVRTADQTEIALYWADGGGTATPPGHWNRIATQISLASGESILDRARTLALLNMAMADAGIAAWDSKFEYDLWRPIDAIRRADEDGNVATVADTAWLPLLRTPPFPSYTSGHSTFSGAAAAVMTELFGENLSFTSHSDSHSGLTPRPLAAVTARTFESFHAAAEEAGMSRIYGGIHYRFDDTQGSAAGQAIGLTVVNHWLLPI